MTTDDDLGCGKVAALGKRIRGVGRCGRRYPVAGLVLCEDCKAERRGLPVADTRDEEHAALARAFLNSD